ncbi:23S rRNA (adenine(2503)-C(2))-methyltransferase RlmN [Sandaracinus amylolyticus]|uniref:23S rRNA (adenine(2503)-C(2))-methyltransferase RlmN n=1 Tax=Sandaracinus amylolyticus TaxID=927083 RepID=UPI001F009426|nr:radical SAM protein [Sandaracinus amylolyticus]
MNVLPTPPPGTILADVHAHLARAGAPPYRYRQLVLALQRGAQRFDDVGELPRSLRDELSARFGPTVLPLELVTVRSAPQVEKVLFETRSGARLETVLSRYRAGWSSVCVSTQAGCGLGCSFCATGALGLSRNLSADEICAQVVHRRWQSAAAAAPDSVAFMGMGEALANPNVFTALQLLTTAGYGGLSPRRITVSTVGFAPSLERLTREHPQVTITLSVHSPFPAQRAELVPLERRFSLAENLAILDCHVVAVRRKVYLAYLLIAGVNDSDDHLQALVQLARSRARPELFHVSVIRYNDASGADPSHRAPSSERVDDFVSRLRAAGVRATRRQQLGASIDAACGQLHARSLLRDRRPS